MKPFENIVGKEETVGFLFFLQCFLPICRLQRLSIWTSLKFVVFYRVKYGGWIETLALRRFDFYPAKYMYMKLNFQANTKNPNTVISKLFLELLFRYHFSIMDLRTRGRWFDKIPICIVLRRKARESMDRYTNYHDNRYNPRKGAYTINQSTNL